MQTDEEYLREVLLNKLEIDCKRDNLDIRVCKLSKSDHVYIQVHKNSIFTKKGKKFEAMEVMLHLIAILNHYDITWTYGYKDIITTRPDLTKILVSVKDIDQLSFLIKSYTQQKVLI